MAFPSIAQVGAFFAVYTHGSTVRAARTLGKSQSQISANIARLEDEMGTVLFVRANGRLHPTERADELAELARELLDAYQRFTAQGSDFGTDRQFTIGAPRSLSMTLLPKVSKALRTDLPGLKIKLRFRSYQEIVTEVAEGDLDIGITKLPVLDKRVLVQPMCDAPSVVLMPKDHPLVGKDHIQPSDIGNQPMIRLGTGLDYWEKIELAFRDQKLTANFAFEVGGVGPACRMVAEGLGLSIVNQLMAEDYLDLLGLAARRFKPEIMHRFVCVSSPFSEKAILLKKFNDTVATHVTQRRQTNDAAE
ncbi:MAG: LysR family transcriptional regulator [Roseibium sp.]|uniref:LysR family transcriptional regulator n=1 Tax=Roseibium sp. TaxID=1936156 RepID=UPI002619EC47|nr:LysR family transcriptional regulator [Roseibium sp.]MCV0426157.1 LysR family transcriptional regulator [Roseibium sp.]